MDDEAAMNDEGPLDAYSAVVVGVAPTPALTAGVD